MGEIPILGAKAERVRSDEQRGHDQRLAAMLAQLALEADAGNVDACGFAFMVQGEKKPRSYIHDHVESRGALTERLALLVHMLRTTETNMLMAQQPGGAPRAVRGQDLIGGAA